MKYLFDITEAVVGKIWLILFLLIIPLLLITCEKPQRIVKLTTLNATAADISYTTVTLKGEITDIGPETIQDHGIFVSENSIPVQSNSIVKSLGTKSSKGTFQAQFTGLTEKTDYYYRAYVSVNSVLTLGEIKQFKTKEIQIATITAGSISQLTMNTATLSGNITSDGGEPVTKRGLCWSTNSNPSITECLDSTVNGSGTGTFTGLMHGLTPATRYRVRAYAISAKGIAYNNSDIIFTTHDIPTISTTSVSSITATTALSGGDVTNDGGVSLTSRGVCWSTISGPTVSLTAKTDDGTATGSFISNLTSLIPGTTYYVRAFATNQFGTGYGNERTFNTSIPITASTTGATSVTSTNVVLNGNVSPNNYSTTVSFLYGTTTSYGTEVPAIQSPVSGPNQVSVTSALGGLIPGTTYHYKVKAVCTAGFIEGSDMAFTTLMLPVATADIASSVTISGATLNGFVNANNSSTTVTFEYGPTTAYGSEVIAPQSPVSGNTDISVNAVISGLTAGTICHFRIKAVSAAGTVYSPDQSFTALSQATAVINAATAVTATTAILNGTVNASNNSTTVTFEYGTTTSYGTSITASQSPVSGSSATSVSVNLTGLTQGTTYHFRIKAVSTAGTVYSSDRSFIALVLPAAVTNPATSVTAATALLNGTVNANNNSTIVTFEYGSTTAYGTSVTASQSPVSGAAGTAVSAALSGLPGTTTYHYKVKAVSAAGSADGSDNTFTTLSSINIPTVTTTAITDIAAITATGGGDVTADGGASVTARGVCWSTTADPSITDPKTSDDSGIGAFSSSITGLSSGITYHIRAYATTSAGTGYGADVTFTTLGVPTVATAAASTITSISAISGGNVTSTGGVPVTIKGICWSINPTPNTTDALNINGSGPGSFASSLLGLLPNTTYYIRAFATNSEGTGYGNQVSFTTPMQVTDFDGNVYNTVIIGTQLWMQENLKVTHYRDGSPISNVPSSTWSTLASGAYCWINNNILNKDIYGAIYNSFAAVDNHNLCPTGWHVATDAEWTTLETYLGGSSVAGGKLKETGTEHWISPNTAATNESGFTGLPGGYVTGSTHYSPGSLGHWWSSTWVDQTGITWARRLNNDVSSVFRSGNNGHWGHSVRCIQGEGVVLPSVTTGTVTDIMATSATSGGYVNSSGGSSMVARGVCWSTSPGPVVTGSHSSDGTLTGSFTSSITGLSVGTTYYLRAYATNGVGTAYGEEISFIPVYAVGDNYQGGIIFSISGTYPNQHGLICAQADQSASTTWGCDGSIIAGADGTAIGTGNQNTNDIINGCAEAGIAARICSDLNLNGYTDWYLPSLDELGLLVTKYRETLSADFGGAYYYWSSTEYSGNPSTEALYYNFWTGVSVNISKTQPAHVRAIRSF